MSDQGEMQGDGVEVPPAAPPRTAGKVEIDTTKLPATQLFGMVHLPRGVMDKDGALHRAVSIKQMSGKHAASLVTGGNFDKNRLLNVLCDCCVSFGDYTAPADAKQIREMLTSDVLIVEQQYLLLQLRQLALGPVYDYTARCPNVDRCEHVGEYSVNLPDLTFTGDMDGSPVRVMDFENQDGKVWKVEWHYATAADDKWFAQLFERWQANYKRLKPKEREEEFSPDDLTILMAMFFMRVHAVVDPDGVRHVLRRHSAVVQDERNVMEADPVAFMLTLPLYMFNEFAFHMDEIEPALDNRVEYECEACGAPMETTILMASPSFFAGASRKTRKR
jgi:hypothetical protein